MYLHEPRRVRSREGYLQISRQVDRFWHDCEAKQLRIHIPGVTTGFFLKIEELLQHGDWICRNVPDPLIRLQIDDDGACLQQIKRRFGFQRLKLEYRQRPNIQVTMNAFRREKIRELAISAYAGRHSGIDDDDLATMSETACLGGIEELSFAGENVTDQGFLKLLRSPLFAKIKSIDLGATQISDEGVVELARSHWPGQLEELDLSATNVSDHSLREFEGCDLSQLKKLALGGKEDSQLTEFGFNGFCSNASVTRLTHLNLGFSNLSPGLIEALAGNKRFASVRYLGLTRSSLDDEMAKMLAKSPFLYNLNMIDVYGLRQMTMAGFKALVTSPIMQSVTRLTIGCGPHDTTIDIGAGCKAIAGSKYLTESRHLSLKIAWVADAGIQALANANSLPELESLSVPRISEAAALAIGASTTLGKLTCLLARVDNLSTEARETLVTRFGEDDLHIRSR